MQYSSCDSNVYCSYRQSHMSAENFFLKFQFFRTSGCFSNICEFKFGIYFFLKIFNFKFLKKRIKILEKNDIPKLYSEMFEKHPEVRKNWNLRKKISELIWDFQISTSAIYIRITRRILHLPLELLIISKNN